MVLGDKSRTVTSLTFDAVNCPLRIISLLNTLGCRLVECWLSGKCEESSQRAHGVLLSTGLYLGCACA